MRVDQEGIEWCREEKIISVILKESVAKKVLRPIIQQSTKCDAYKIKNTRKKIIVCNGSIQFNSGTRYIFLRGIF